MWSCQKKTPPNPRKRKKCCRTGSLLHHCESEIPWDAEENKDPQGSRCGPMPGISTEGHSGRDEFSSSPCCRWESPFKHSKALGASFLRQTRAGVLTESGWHWGFMEGGRAEGSWHPGTQAAKLCSLRKQKMEHFSCGFITSSHTCFL